MLRLLQGDVGSARRWSRSRRCWSQSRRGAGGDAGADRDPRPPALRDAARDGRADGVTIALLTGRDKGRARESILMGLSTVDPARRGTHAIFQEAVAYRNLGLVVIDEAASLRRRPAPDADAEGPRHPHCLAMTATPIPRTIGVAQYGEMEVSRLDEMPPGRQAIDTRVVALDRLPD
jgi:ATP-dependent DNA helicase RecG